jgi:hypothetical protein
VSDRKRIDSPFLALSSAERQAIERKLALAYSKDTLPALDAAAVTFVEQGRAFVRLTSGEGFAVARRLEPTDPRAALVLTYSGSLLLCGAPTPPKGRRNFVYQSIDAEGAPREGTFTLLEPILLDHPVVGSRLKTSPARAISVAALAGEWELGKKTLSRVTATLGSIGTGPLRPTDIGGVRSVFVQDERQRRKNADLAGELAAAEAELGKLLERLVEARVDDDALEAEIIGMVLFISRLASDRGLPAVPASKVRAFETAYGETCSLEKGWVEVRRAGAHPTRVDGGSIAGEHVVTGAPAAIVDARGRLIVVLGRVRRVMPR